MSEILEKAAVTTPANGRQPSEKANSKENKEIRASQEKAGKGEKKIIRTSDKVKVKVLEKTKHYSVGQTIMCHPTLVEILKTRKIKHELVK